MKRLVALLLFGLLLAPAFAQTQTPPQPPLIQQVHPGVTYEDCVERCKKCGTGKTRTVSRISAQAIRTENEVRRLCLSSVHHTIRPLLFRFWPLVDLANFPNVRFALASRNQPTDMGQIRTSQHNAHLDQFEKPRQQVATTTITVGARSGRQSRSCEWLRGRAA